MPKGDDDAKVNKEGNLLKNVLKLLLAIAMLSLAASPALAVGPGTGDDRRPDGAGKPGTTPPADKPAPPSKRALGVACKAEGASKSNKNDPRPGTPFSRCVKTLAKAVKTACKDESKKKVEGDTERGTPYSRCVSTLSKALRTSKVKHDGRKARRVCKRPDFDSGREFSNCVRVVAKALRRA